MLDSISIILPDFLVSKAVETLIENTDDATNVTKQGTVLENGALRPACSNTTANPDTSTETQTAEEVQAESPNNEVMQQVHFD